MTAQGGESGMLSPLPPWYWPLALAAGTPLSVCA